jgi:DNA polymerase V
LPKPKHYQSTQIAKKFQDRTQVYVIDSEEKRVKAEMNNKIEDVWGIGHRPNKKMKTRNIATSLDFTATQHEA